MTIMFRRLLPQIGREIGELEAEAKTWFSRGEYHKSLEFWSKMGIMAKTVVKEPSKLLILVRKSVQICLWKLYGNRALQ